MTKSQLRTNSIGARSGRRVLAIVTWLLLVFVTIPCRSEDRVPTEFRRFVWDASQSQTPALLQRVFDELKSSKLLPAGYPKFAKTEIVGEYEKPHTYKAVPIDDVHSSNAILVDDRKYITFEVWSVNVRATFTCDFVYLLKEPDEEAIRREQSGVRRFKYIEVCYEYMMPVNSTGRIGGDFTTTNRIIESVRCGFADAGVQLTSTRGNNRTQSKKTQNSPSDRCF